MGSVKKILTASLFLLKTRVICRDESCTFLQEAAKVINHTPLSEIFCDPTEPFPVCPVTLLNLCEVTTRTNDQFTEEDGFIGLRKKTKEKGAVHK